MSRVHDMGGRFGDGPVVPEPEDGPVFHADWHGRALAVTLAAGALGQWNLDSMRHAREKLSPQDYSAFTYYEKWMAALADMLVARGVITPEELAGGAPAPSELSARKLLPEVVASVLAKGAPTERLGPAPQFAVGDRVMTRRARNADVPGGHTRLPGYADRVPGVIVAVHGPHVFPDSNAHFAGEAPQVLYTVAVRAVDLWQSAEHPEDEVRLDLFEPYLDRA